jgi:hypothetical protein
MSEIRRLRPLEEENGWLKKILVQQALDQDAALNFPSPDKFYKGSQEENTSPMAGFFLDVQPYH